MRASTVFRPISTTTKRSLIPPRKLREPEQLAVEPQHAEREHVAGAVSIAAQQIEHGRDRACRLALAREPAGRERHLHALPRRLSQFSIRTCRLDVVHARLVAVGVHRFDLRRDPFACLPLDRVAIVALDLALGLVERDADIVGERLHLAIGRREHFNRLDWLRRRHDESVLRIRLNRRRRDGFVGLIRRLQPDLTDAVHIHPIELRHVHGLRGRPADPGIPRARRRRRSPPAGRHGAEIDGDGQVELRHRPVRLPVVLVVGGERNHDAIAAQRAHAEHRPRLGGSHHRQRRGHDANRARSSNRHRRGVYSRV